MAANFVGMLTKYILTIGSTEHEIPDECLKNWDEIAFSLKRTDYSGVMRSFSTEFVFVGDIKDLLWDLYLTDGFLASASVAVYTITNTHEWEKQYEADLDFSTIAIEDGAMSINALDSALASKLKSKKSQKYEYDVSDFSVTRLNMNRILMRNNGLYSFMHTDNPTGDVTTLLNESGSTIISKEYVELSSEVRGSDAVPDELPAQEFFAKVVKSGINVALQMKGYVRCYFCPYTKDSSIQLLTHPDVDVSYLRVKTIEEAQGGGNQRTIVGTLISDDIQSKNIHGSNMNILVNTIKENVFSSLNDLKSAAEARWGSNMGSEFNGVFGVVGPRDNPCYSEYWQQNEIYEFQNGRWVYRGHAESYYQDRDIRSFGTGGWFGSVTVNVPSGHDNTYIGLVLEGKMFFQYGSLTVDWNDPIKETVSCRGISPQELAQKLVDSIAGEGFSVSIAEDNAGLLSKTLIVPGEELRRISNAKIYTTFGNFADWMEAVFGYTYRTVGNELQFVHRSAVFVDEVAKTIENFRDFKFEIVDDLIYSQVEAGYSKKEYGEIDGRLETNFTNYYTTGYELTDKKCSLISKYRADSYGVEFTIRKGESDTKDDKADEDVFFVRFVEASGGVNNYLPAGMSYYAPSVCANNNQAFIAVPGNGKAVTLTMTSSDGNNGLTDITIPAGTALFTAAELEFTTEDMELPSDLNALVQIDHNGYRYTGYIKEAEARFGRLNGVDYKLIVKEITEL